MQRKNLLDKMMPPKYDFYKMLTDQAQVTTRGVAFLVKWMENPSKQNYQELIRSVREADEIRLHMEEQLVEAFSTPFDRQDIYTFSVRMDRIVEFAKAAVLALQVYGVDPDHAAIAMAKELLTGTEELAKATALLKDDPQKAEDGVEVMRRSYIMVEDHYRSSMAILFAQGDPMEAIKRREVYLEIRNGAEYLELVVDVFHRILVRLM